VCAASTAPPTCDRGRTARHARGPAHAHRSADPLARRRRCRRTRTACDRQAAARQPNAGNAPETHCSPLPKARTWRSRLLEATLTPTVVRARQRGSSADMAHLDGVSVARPAVVRHTAKDGLTASRRGRAVRIPARLGCPHQLSAPTLGVGDNAHQSAARDPTERRERCGSRRATTRTTPRVFGARHHHGAHGAQPSSGENSCRSYDRTR
jgi:hypothetical protein